MNSAFNVDSVWYLLRVVSRLHVFTRTVEMTWNWLFWRHRKRTTGSSMTIERVCVKQSSRKSLQVAFVTCFLLNEATVLHCWKARSSIVHSYGHTASVFRTERARRAQIKKGCWNLSFEGSSGTVLLPKGGWPIVQLRKGNSAKWWGRWTCWVQTWGARGRDKWRQQVSLNYQTALRHI